MQEETDYRGREEGRSVSSGKSGELSPELLNVRLEAAAFLPHSQLSVRTRDWAAAEEITHPAFTVSSPLQKPTSFFLADSGGTMLKLGEEGFPPSVCVSVETWCGVKEEDTARKSGGVQECLEEEEEEEV